MCNQAVFGDGWDVEATDEAICRLLRTVYVSFGYAFTAWSRTQLDFYYYNAGWRLPAGRWFHCPLNGQGNPSLWYAAIPGMAATQDN